MSSRRNEQAFKYTDWPSMSYRNRKRPDHHRRLGMVSNQLFQLTVKVIGCEDEKFGRHFRRREGLSAVAVNSCSRSSAGHVRPARMSLLLWRIWAIPRTPYFSRIVLVVEVGTLGHLAGIDALLTVAPRPRLPVVD